MFALVIRVTDGRLILTCFYALMTAIYSYYVTATSKKRTLT